MKKIGILGGAFDPIHKGHILIGQQAYEELGLDEIWVMPNGRPPHKSVADENSQNHRLAMIQIAINGLDYFHLNKFEMEEKERYYYSYETMRCFANLNSGYEFYFIVGYDSLMSLERWKCPEELLKYTKIVAFNRDQRPVKELEDKSRELMKSLGGDIIVIDKEVLEISSTSIRAMIQSDIDIENVLDKDVHSYIIEHDLYK